jgi:hypothetical protein
MATKRMQPFWTAGILAAGLFLILLLVRMEVFEHLFSGPKSVSMDAGSAATTRESWMNIYQTNRKIGFAHTRLTPQAAGYELQEKILAGSIHGHGPGPRLQTRAICLIYR